MDAIMIKNGMPSETLMEIAGHQCAVAIQQHCDDTSTFLILCGGGNNGGDGYVVGRWLNIWGFDVTLCSVVGPKTTDAIKMPNDVNIWVYPPFHGLMCMVLSTQKSCVGRRHFGNESKS